VLRSSPLAVATTVFLLYGVWVGIAHFHLHHRMADFAEVGQQFVEKSSSSAAIDADRGLVTSPSGYDGQFFLFMAQDPRGAVGNLDNPSYRYGRPVYPILARGLALGQRSAIPFMLVAINVLAAAMGTLALAILLRRRGQSPWYALIFGLYPGIFVAVLRDLSEALAYALVAWAILLFDGANRRGLVASSALLAVAALTRETTLLFAFVCAGLLLARDRSLRRALPFAAGAAVPYLLYRLVFLRHWLGHAGVPHALLPTPVPFGGIGHYFPWDVDRIQLLYGIVIPGTFCLGLAIWALRRRRTDLGLWAVVVNVLFCVVFLPAAAYADIYSTPRIATGVVLAFVLSLPALTALRPSGRVWLWLPVIAWMAPWWDLLPGAFQNPFP
jgi:hypothetical protein